MKKILMSVSLICFLIVISACQNSSEPTDANESDAQDSASEGTSSNDNKDELTFVSSQVVVSIDPAKHTDSASTYAVVNTYDPLLYPKVDEESMEAGAHIATEWDISDDGKTYTLDIRDDVVFQSGNPLTADDVVYSMKRIIEIQQGYAWLWDGILDPESVIATDSHTVEMTLNQAYAPFLSTLIQLYVLDSKVVAENQEDGEFGENGDYGQAFLEANTAGSGPYVINEWTRGSEMVLSQYEGYWKGWEGNHYRKINHLVVPEEATRKTMMKSGEAQITDEWMSTESQLELSKDLEITTAEDPSVQLFHISMHTQKAPLDDINVRKAISYAFDYVTENEQVLIGAVKAEGPVPVLTPGHSDDAVVYEQDLEKAKEYISQAKYSGDELKVEYYYVTDLEEERKTGLLLQNVLEEIGIDVEVKGVPWTQITEMTANKETTPHMVALYDGLTYPHVDSHTFGIYHPSSQGSYRAASWYENSEVTEILDKARKATDLNEGLALYEEVQNIITEDAVSIFIANPMHRVTYRNSLEGYNFVGLVGYDMGFYHFRYKN